MELDVRKKIFQLMQIMWREGSCVSKTHGKAKQQERNEDRE